MRVKTIAYKLTLVSLFVLFFSGQVNNFWYDETRLVKISCYETYYRLFQETTEYLAIVFPEGRIILVTTEEINRIIIPADLDEVIRKNYNIELKNAVLIIHNHTVLARFTEPDKRLYYFFFRLGFRGKFAIYVRSLDKVIYFPYSENQREKD